MKAYSGKPSALFSQKTAKDMLGIAREIKPEEFFGLKGLSYGFGAILFGVSDAFCFMHPGSNNPGTSSMLIANPTAGKGAVIMTNGVQGMLFNNQMVADIALVYEWPSHKGAQSGTE
jgi:hypothetical protein